MFQHGSLWKRVIYELWTVQEVVSISNKCANQTYVVREMSWPQLWVGRTCILLCLPKSPPPPKLFCSSHLKWSLTHLKWSLSSLFHLLQFLWTISQIGISFIFLVSQWDEKTESDRPWRLKTDNAQMLQILWNSAKLFNVVSAASVPKRKVDEARTCWIYILGSYAVRLYVIHSEWSCLISDFVSILKHSKGYFSVERVNKKRKGSK